jgi:hypothetical protein
MIDRKLEELVCEGVVWIHVAQDSVYWGAVFGFHKKRGTS